MSAANALPRQIHVLLDEEVLHAARSRGGKRGRPVEAALADRGLRIPAAASVHDRRPARLDVEILQVHREEPARVFLEVVGRDHAHVVGGHLELEADQLRISHLDHVVVDELPVRQLHEVEGLVVRARTHAGLGDLGRHLVELADELLRLFERPRGRHARRRALDRRHHDLLETEVLRPRDGARQVVAELREHEVAADRLEPGVLDHLPGRLGVVHQALVFRIERAAEEAAELDLIDADGLELLQQVRELPFRDQRAMRIGLAADRKPQRVRAQSADIRGQEPGYARPDRRFLKKLASRNSRHACLLWMLDCRSGGRCPRLTSRSNMSRLIGALLGTLALLGTACTRSAEHQPSSGGPGRYPISGTVIRQPDARTVTLAHNAIKDYMPAMAMDFQGDGLPSLRPGDRIRATLVVSDGTTMLTDVVVTGSLPSGASTPLVGVSGGLLVPDVELRNQFGTTIRLSDFRDRVCSSPLSTRGVRSRISAHG